MKIPNFGRSRKLRTFTRDGVGGHSIGPDRGSAITPYGPGGSTPIAVFERHLLDP